MAVWVAVAIGWVGAVLVTWGLCRMAKLGDRQVREARRALDHASNVVPLGRDRVGE